MGRRLAQHFLTDPAILDRIVDALQPEPEDVVIEVGPGKGSLTRRLAPRVGRVIAIERDEQLAELLRDPGAGSGEPRPKVAAGDPVMQGVHVVCGDAMEVDWHRELREAPQFSAPRSRIPDPRFKVVGNIPYYITTPLIDKALVPPLPQVIVFLIQREVADRLVAKHGNKTYGALTVGVGSVATVERLFIVRPGSFAPPPKVDSAVVRITPRSEPLLASDEISDFRRFNTALFSQRRKQLRRILRSVGRADPREIDEKLSQLDLDPTARPEELPPETIVELFRTFS